MCWQHKVVWHKELENFSQVLHRPYTNAVEISHSSMTYIAFLLFSCKRALWGRSSKMCTKVPFSELENFVSERIFGLTLFILVHRASKQNYGTIINTVQCDSICRYLLPLDVLVSWPSSEGIRLTCSETTITKFVIHRSFYLKSYL
jgi:hypothetical protein